MTIKVTFQVQGKSRRREYKTYKRAITGVRSWLSKNHGRVLLYEPGEQPTIYTSVLELPNLTPSSQADFYRTKAWRDVRYKVLSESDKRCQLCGTSPEQGSTMHVDHIKPRSLYPDLALEENNLQILCEDCNIGKMTNELAL